MWYYKVFGKLYEPLEFLQNCDDTLCMQINIINVIILKVMYDLHFYTQFSNMVVENNTILKFRHICYHVSKVSFLDALICDYSCLCQTFMCTYAASYLFFEQRKNIKKVIKRDCYQIYILIILESFWIGKVFILISLFPSY